MQSQNSSQQFIERFTEEIILGIMARLVGRERGRLEEQRLKTVIITEKLRQKFSNNLQNKPLSVIKKVVPIASNSFVTFTKPVLPTQARPPLEQGFNRPAKNAMDIDFGKLEVIIRDKLVSYIECSGPGVNIIVKKSENMLKTQIILTKEEIIKIIKSFSEKVNIPLIEGMLIARSEDLSISAVVSETLDPSFIIKREISNPIVPNTGRSSNINILSRINR